MQKSAHMEYQLTDISVEEEEEEVILEMESESGKEFEMKSRIGDEPEAATAKSPKIHSHDKEFSNYEVLSAKEITQSMRDTIDETNSILNLSTATIRVLLNHFGWDKDKFLETYFLGGDADRERIFREAVGLHHDSSSEMSSSSPVAVPLTTMNGGEYEECTTCYDKMLSAEMFGMECGHRFCSACWTQYLTNRIGDEGMGQYLSCLAYNCNTLLDDAIVMEFMKDSSIQLKYQQKILNDFVQFNRQLKWCPSPDCVYAVRFKDSASKSNVCRTVTCKCGHSFCFECAASSHDPISCEMLEKWLALREKELEDEGKIKTLACTKPGETVPLGKTNWTLEAMCLSYFNSAQSRKSAFPRLGQLSDGLGRAQGEMGLKPYKLDNVEMDIDFGKGDGTMELLEQIKMNLERSRERDVEQRERNVERREKEVERREKEVERRERDLERKESGLRYSSFSHSNLKRAKCNYEPKQRDFTWSMEVDFRGKKIDLSVGDMDLQDSESKEEVGEGKKDRRLADMDLQDSKSKEKMGEGGKDLRVEDMDLQKIVEVVREGKKSLRLGDMGLEHQESESSLTKKVLSTSSWLKWNTKNCPNCKAPIEKTGGCNYMRCSNCRHQFCWLCLAQLKEHFHSCEMYIPPIPRPKDVKQEPQQAPMSPYQFYVNRFENHKQSHKLENKLYEKMKDKLKYEEVTDSYYPKMVFQAIDILQRCRPTLQYTSVFAFFVIPSTDNCQMEIFKKNLEDLHSAVERLSGNLESALDYPFSSDDAGKRMEKIIELFSYCESRRQVLIDHVHEGDEKKWWKFQD